ncbi:MAG: iron-containing alcohol dehydrogenase [Candidatus Hodarchaeales archaeon]|jgi:alcohol dehydrogenase class IV
MWDFTSPRKVIFGEDALEFLSIQSFKHAFIVTDRTMKELHFDKIETQLRQTKTRITVFDEIPGEPTFKIVQKGAKILVETKPDVIIAFGGGSVMDAAKGMWVMWANPDEGLDAIEGLNPIESVYLREKTKCILINIPTTSGTGSDATWATVLTDESAEVERKASFGNRELVGDVIILDPILTKTMPSHLRAGTGLDALCHAVDGYLSDWRNDFSDALTRHAFKLLWENLPIAFEQGKNGETDEEILEKLHNAATMAGWGFGNSQIILAHSLGHSVGAVFKIPHSVCIGAMCWYSLMYNREAESTRIADLARLVNLTGSSDEELTAELNAAFKDLLIKLELPLSLKDMKISREQYEAKCGSLIDYALNDSGTLTNPRPVDYEDFEKIFEYAYEGKEIDF